MKSRANPADLNGLAEDLDRAAKDHPDAIEHNPDIAAELKKVRDKTRERFERVTDTNARPPIK